MSEKEYNQKLLKVVLRVQRHWRVVTARKVFANKAVLSEKTASYTASFSRNRRDAKVTIGPVCEAAASYTGSTADKQTFLLHWQAGEYHFGSVRTQQ